MEEHITQEIVEELKEIQSFLEEEYEESAPVMVQRLTRINAYMARTGYLYAIACADQDRAIAGVFAENAKAIRVMPATISQKFINTLCDKENYYVKWLERLNKTCTHQADNIRTQVSFQKEELSLTKRGY